VVRTHEEHFAFNTSTILLKLYPKFSTEKQLFLEKYALRLHAFIPDFYYLKTGLSSAAEVKLLEDELQRLPFVKASGVKQVFTLQAATNDPFYDRQWSIENTGSNIQSNGTPGSDMSVDSAWTISEGSTSIKIAILDSGVDTLHEDLINNILPGYDGFRTDSTDTKGYPSPNFSSDGHGTACAGIAAAVGNNNLGIAGIAYQCKIVPIKIFYYQDYGGTAGVQATTNTDALITGTAYAWRIAQVDVMSTSAGLSSLFVSILNINVQLANDEINEAFLAGRNGFGVPMFYSAGNDNFSDVLWPAELDNTIAVGASSMCDERKNPNDCSPENWGSSYGKQLDVVAPGVRIMTTDMTGTNGYSSGDYTSTFNGTSASCPNAAGVGALILSINPSLHARDVKAILNITADRIGAYAYDSTTIHGTWNEEVAHGRINAFEALKLSENYETTVNIASVKNEIQLSIFPNPSNGQVFIQNDFEDNLDCLIYNILGEVILTAQINQGLVEVSYDFDLGTYFFKIPKLNLVKKFMIID
jgi:subtilisin family serine protease